MWDNIVSSGWVWGNDVKYIDMTELAKEVFGDIVVKAFRFENEHGPRNGRWQNAGGEESPEPSICPYDTYPVFVEFTSGAKVVIWSSEWGGVIRIN